MKNTDYLTISEIAEILNISKQMVHAIIRSGELTAIKLGPRSVRIARSEFERYLNDKTLS